MNDGLRKGNMEYVLRISGWWCSRRGIWTNHRTGIRFESCNLSSEENVFLLWICRSSSSSRCDVYPYVMWELLNGKKNRKEKLSSLQSMYSLSTRRVVTMPSTHQAIFLSGPPLNLINGDGDDDVDDGGSGVVL